MSKIKELLALNLAATGPTGASQPEELLYTGCASDSHKRIYGLKPVLPTALSSVAPSAHFEVVY
ncbi:hypothetical protein [Citrobacter youngae]|uniref:hypothetical protein n=1 Tax=Citrobacter youngae TaxID=133448 RepID=UPI00287C97B1|nr:hypothetical protein [Citrobacter youngae]